LDLLIRRLNFVLAKLEGWPQSSAEKHRHRPWLRALTLPAL
jgi:hypothetical protein